MRYGLLMTRRSYTTEEQIAGLVPALRSHLDSFGSYLGGGAVRRHVAMYCRGLFSEPAPQQRRADGVAAKSLAWCRMRQ